MVHPLHKLLKKDVKWTWNETHENAVSAIRKAIAESPTLAHHEEDAELLLKTDESKTGQGAVLSVIRSDTSEQPLTFISRRTADVEQRYDSNELECLALVWALEKLRPYLYGRRFTVLTDNIAVKWLHSKKNVQGKLARWILALQDYQFDVKHIKGSENIVADALSRATTGPAEITDPAERLLCALTGCYFPTEELALLQQDDEKLRSIIRQLQQDKIDPQLESEFVYSKGVLY